MRGFSATLILLSASSLAGAQNVDGRLVKWHPITISFVGPRTAETDDLPNPFLDFRLQVVFSGPDNQLFVVPGFFDGDGQGGSTGNTWRVRFTPNVPGIYFDGDLMPAQMRNGALRAQQHPLPPDA